MNRSSAFDSSIVPTEETAQALLAWIGRQQGGLRRLQRRIAAFEPELTAAAVIAPLVIAVVAALPIFVTA